MFGIHDLALFVFSGFLLNITPGADMLYVISRASTQGFRAGAIASLGIGSGCLIHVTFAMIGLSMILATSAFAFTCVKYIGAAYLLYLGIKLLLEKNQNISRSPEIVAQHPLSKVFWQGMCVNALNPKVALFFLAFVPQFIDTSSPHTVAAFFILGMLFNTMGTAWNVGVAWSSAHLSHRIKTSNHIGRWLKRIMGGLFVGLGFKLAWSENQ